MEASFPTSLERDAQMHEPDFWTGCAEAMEMSIEDNRLIVQEIAEAAGNLWKRVKHACEGLFHGAGQHGHLPPI